MGKILAKEIKNVNTCVEFCIGSEWYLQWTVALEFLFKKDHCGPIMTVFKGLWILYFLDAHEIILEEISKVLPYCENIER